MGGRGASRSIALRVPKLKNPAGIPSNHMTEDEYLALLGLKDAMSGYAVDKLRGNRILKTDKGKERFEKEVIKAEEEYQAKREKAKVEYQKLVEKGKIVPKTTIEKTLTKAHGHPDLASTQSARRMAYKRGYDWKTGKKLKNIEK